MGWPSHRRSEQWLAAIHHYLSPQGLKAGWAKGNGKPWGPHARASGNDNGRRKGKGKGTGPLGNRDKNSDKCLCCGKQGHQRKECPDKDKQCKICCKTGLLAATCHATTRPPRKAPQGLAEASAETKELETQMYCWQCPNVDCNAWMHSELAKQCRLCKTRRKVKQEVVEKDMMNVPQGKQTSETIERLKAGTPEEEELGTWPESQEDSETTEKRNELLALIGQMEKAGFDATEPKARLAKLPPPTANRQLKDRANLTAYELKVTEHYVRTKKSYAAKLQEVDQEVQTRKMNVEKEFAKAVQEHNARMEAIRQQHEQHMEDTLVRQKTWSEKMEMLETQYATKKKELETWISKAASGEGGPIAPTPTPVQKLGCGALDTKIKETLANVTEDEINALKAIFGVAPALVKHPKPPPGGGKGSTSGHGAQELPAVPDDVELPGNIGGTNVEQQDRDVTMSEEANGGSNKAQRTK